MNVLRVGCASTRFRSNPTWLVLWTPANNISSTSSSPSKKLLSNKNIWLQNSDKLWFKSFRRKALLTI